MTRTIASPEPAETCASDAPALTKFNDEIGANAVNSAGAGEAFILAGPVARGEHAERESAKKKEPINKRFRSNIVVSRSTGISGGLNRRWNFAGSRQPDAARAAQEVASKKAKRKNDEYEDWDHHDHKANQKQDDRPADVNAISQRFFHVTAKSGSGGDNDSCGRLQMDGDSRKARSVFKEPFPSLEFFNLCAHFSYLALHFQSVLDFVGLLHDFEKLRLQSLLSSDAGFEVDELLGDVLAGLFLFQDVFAEPQDLVLSRSKLRRGNANDEGDVDYPL